MPRLRQDSLVSNPPERGLQASVIIPVRNEEELLPSALLSLAEQKTQSGLPLDHSAYEVIVLINNSTDRSTEIAKHFQRLYPELRLHVVERQLTERYAHVGYARRILMDAASRRLQRIGSSGAILSTDADSRVTPNWIAENLAELRDGADVVGGRILIAPEERAGLDSDTSLVQKINESYRRLVSWMECHCDPEVHDPWPRHHHHYGASLAIRPGVYERVGKLPPRRHLEDLALYSALVRQDFRIRHSMKVRVYTSARLSGRADFGWAKTLSEWQRSARSALKTRVESKAFLQSLFTIRRRLRELWSSTKKDDYKTDASLREICDSLGIKPVQLASLIDETRHFGELLERTMFYQSCRDRWPDWKRLKPLDEAVRELFDGFKSVVRGQLDNDSVAASR